LSIGIIWGGLLFVPGNLRHEFFYTSRRSFSRFIFIDAPAAREMLSMASHYLRETIAKFLMRIESLPVERFLDENIFY